MHLAQITDATGDGQLHARCTQPRPGMLAAIDRVARNDVETRFRGSGAEAGCEALVEIEPGMLERQEQVLFDRDGSECEWRRLIDE